MSPGVGSVVPPSHVGVKLSSEKHFENIERIDVFLGVAEVAVELLVGTLLVVEDVRVGVLVVDSLLFGSAENFEGSRDFFEGLCSLGFLVFVGVELQSLLFTLPFYKPF